MIPSGPFAICPHQDPLPIVQLTCHRTARVELGRLALRIWPEWMFETYLTSPDDGSKNTTTALIHLPVKKAQTLKRRVC